MTRWTLFAIALLLPATAMAKPAFSDWVPNGGEFTCQLCHVSTSPPVTWNTFGEDVRETLASDKPDWAAICDLDSDGDDASNGVELGDPDCSWVFGDSDPPVEVFDPSDADSAPAEPEPFAEDAGGSTDDEDVSGGSVDGPDGSSGGGSGAGSNGSSGGGSGGGSGCAGGSTAPLTGLAMLLGLALVSRRRLI